MIMRVEQVVMATMVVSIVVFGPKRGEGAAPRAFFVFGDSLVDSGNNNYLPTTARADSRPYGIDYPTHRPTGRFSNGFNLPDIISQRIGSEPTLPYLSPELNGPKLLVGANFASAGIGILNDTGVQFVRILRMYEQFELFEEYQERLSAEVGSERAKKIVNGALVLITLGGNDFVNNYFVTPFSPRSRQFTISQFSRYLISEYTKILQRLYELGARRVLVSGTGPLGCVPSQLASKSTNGDCVPELQEAAQIYNPLLVQMTRDLNSQVGSDVFVAVNAFIMNMDFITKPQTFGFVTSKVACCGQGRYNGIGTCTSLSNLCPNRDIYAFWDAFHPTQRALGFIVDAIFSGTNDVMSPMNLTTVMALDSNI
ncbi:GDSL esterase/lipase At4g28780-like [Arachis stenosperma]|uniref:GDSL esterase/lipase At4g28780-like n=1 Tax=Arachis stenosperma TaxID=217475 RepID=UPI0025AB6327|nr:GDSL esterase/lipase At4g28780-like [Arachis stenosperma]